MKTIRVLTVIFDATISGKEVVAFRGAIINKVGKNNILFHNHLNGAYLYQYPLIQYKQIDKHPAIICIEKGVDEIHHFFQKNDWTISLNGRDIEMKILNLHLNKFNLNVYNTKFNYKIYHWIPLNQQNYREYKKIVCYKNKIEFLENILKANILSFAKTIEWTIDKTIELNITNISKEYSIEFKNNKLLSFDLSFISNTFIPNYIGLGKNPSLGFGIIKQQKENLSN